MEMSRIKQITIIYPPAQFPAGAICNMEPFNTLRIVPMTIGSRVWTYYWGLGGELSSFLHSRFYSVFP
jgi:hypothetical protein